MIRVAVDQVHVQRRRRVAGASEVALFPADDRRLTDAAMTASRFASRASDFDVAAESALLAADRTGTSARSSPSPAFAATRAGGSAALELEHYPGMAEAEIGRIAEEAATRWPLHGITVIHRHGKLRPGDNIVLVVTASAHRQAAFEAADFLMDFLKTRAPFWKKEHGPDAGDWVAAKDDDDRAAAALGSWRRGRASDPPAVAYCIWNWASLAGTLR